MLSSDIFYHIEPGLEGYGRLPAHGVLGVEMEIGGALHAGRPLRRRGAHHLHHDRRPRHRRARSTPKPGSPRSRTWWRWRSTSRSDERARRLASALGRNDERPNVELAEALAQRRPQRADAAEGLVARVPPRARTGTVASPAERRHQGARTRSASTAPRDWSRRMRRRLSSRCSQARNNRNVWGAMQRLDSHRVAAAKASIGGAAERASSPRPTRVSVIAKDKAMSILGKLASGRRDAEAPCRRCSTASSRRGAEPVPDVCRAGRRAVTGAKANSWRDLEAAARQRIEAPASARGSVRRCCASWQGLQSGPLRSSGARAGRTRPRPRCSGGGPAPGRVVRAAPHQTRFRGASRQRLAIGWTVRDGQHIGRPHRTRAAACNLCNAAAFLPLFALISSSDHRGRPTCCARTMPRACRKL